MSVRRKGLSVDIILIIVSFVLLGVAILLWYSATVAGQNIMILITSITILLSVILIFDATLLIMNRLKARVERLEIVVDPELQSQQEPQVRLVTLSNSERRVLNQLRSLDGPLTQRELQDHTGLSKATLSVALSSLEMKGIVQRDQVGRTNVVSLIRDVET
ncbi:MAG: helix-turn-helix transcriptional regulator [Candidatus Hodarchaeota archaeon]